MLPKANKSVGTLPESAAIARRPYSQRTRKADHRVVFPLPLARSRQGSAT